MSEQLVNGRFLAEMWLATQLSSLDTRVYRHPAPNGAVEPYVTIGLLSGVDVRSMGNPTRVERLTYDVSAWDLGTSSLRVNRLAARANHLLDSPAPTTLDGGIILSCKRLGAIPVTTSLEEGTLYQRDGAMYRIEVLVQNT